ncbi:uncharacterized protein LOC123005963 [Tribolium madens]|uniref:uncharacterized protein LOC123005963 n=1 Tax=Tribolium madens TaxID=41895 RepID=UPI001CF735DE|nr:uncharacterized protein LOC123005963 [Tribolium madens]
MSNKQDALSNSGSNSSIYDDGISDKDYENETFEEDTHEDDSYEEMSQSTLQRLRDSHKAGTFPNKTFTSSQIREIERQNTILMNKILKYSRQTSKPKVTLPNRYHPTSAAINRKKNQKKIDWENQILLRKIQTVKPSIKY